MDGMQAQIKAFIAEGGELYFSRATSCLKDLRQSCCSGSSAGAATAAEADAFNAFMVSEVKLGADPSSPIYGLWKKIVVEGKVSAVRLYLQCMSQSLLGRITVSYHCRITERTLYTLNGAAG
jgi:hypothetical protein